MRMKIKKLMVFVFGSIIGILLENLYRRYQDQLPTFVGHNVSNSFYVVKKNAIYSIAEQLYGKNDKKAAKNYKQVRILCWIATVENNLLTKAQAVKDTWGNRCNVLLIFSSNSNKSFPAIKLNVKEGYEELWSKTLAAWDYIYENHREDADWFVKADDDTFMIIENLRFFLSKYRSKEPHYFGRNLKHITHDYNSGGAGYVFSMETLLRFISVLDRCHPKSKAEDMNVAHCLAKVGVFPGETRDEYGRDTFHPFAPDFHLIPGAIGKENWLYRFNKWEVINGPGCCSSHSIAFHYIPPKRMFLPWLVAKGQVESEWNC